MRRLLALALIAGVALAAAPSAAPAAVISIVNVDSPGEGFNDPTVVAPVGGNPGTTVGQQRYNVFQHAADIWGAILPSDVQILVRSSFDPLSCTATSAVLGSAGTRSIHANFPNAEWTGTWYHQALANKLAGSDLSGLEDIQARFNSGIGATGCMTGYSWYYGYDSNEGASQIDLLPVVLHELAHGLGFSSFVSLADGVMTNGLPDVYTRFIRDNSSGKMWPQMTDAERVASAVNGPNVVWDGTAVDFMAPLTLGPQSVMVVDAPVGIAGTYITGTAAFGAPITSTPVAGDVVLADDGAAPGSDACTALVNGGAMAGRIALIDRGTCAFTVKAKNAQNAGAIAVIIADNVAGVTPPGLGGSDPTITIPVVSITQSLGTTLKANLAAGVHVSLALDPALRAGADAAGHVLLYAPNPLQQGSSISHWDVSATPNLLMEPAVNPDLGSAVDLTRYLFEDIGWLPRTTAVPPRPLAGGRLAPGAPNPFSGVTTLRFVIDRGGAADLDVLDLGGRRVRRLSRGTLGAGTHAVSWDGSDDSGRRMAPGVYVVRLRADGRQESRSIVLFR